MRKSDIVHVLARH